MNAAVLIGLRHRIKGDAALCELIGQFCGEGGGWPIIGTSIHASSNFEKIMTTILEEANAGAFTLKGQAIDRRNELVEIERAEAWALAEATARGEPSSGGTAATADHRAAGKFFGEDVESRHPLDCST